MSFLSTMAASGNPNAAALARSWRGPSSSVTYSPRSRFFCTRQEELHSKGGLADACTARDERDASLQEPVAEALVEPRNARFQTRGDFQGWHLGGWAVSVAREDRDTAVPDHHVVATFEVGGIAEFIHLDVALTLRSLLRRAEDDDTVHHRFFDAKTTDLARTVGDVSRKEPDGLRVLDDAAQVKDLVAVELRARDLVKEYRDRIDHYALGYRATLGADRPSPCHAIGCPN